MFLKRIKTSLALASLVFALSACQQAPENSGITPETATNKTDDFKTYDAASFFATTSMYGSSISHDGSAVLVSSDESGIYNAYRIPLDGSEKQALTKSTTDSTYAESWFPKDDRIIVSADLGGNELNHVYVRELDGKLVDLTPGEALRAEFFGWHENQDHFYVLTTERDPRFFDLYLYSTKDYSREMIFQNDAGFDLKDVSKDANWLALAKANSSADSDIFLVDLSQETATPKLIAGDEEESIAYSIYTFSADNERLLYGSNKGSEFTHVMNYSLTDGSHSVDFEADWDVIFSYFSKNGKYQVNGINQDAQTVLSITEVATGKEVTMPTLPPGDLRGVNFTADETEMVFYLNSDTSPSNLYHHKIGSDKVVQLSNNGNPKIKQAHLVAGETRRFKSFDGLEIPGILYKPKQAETEKVPAIVWIHGGPGGQSRFGYSAMIQHLVNNGYAIFMINNRGSSGYGKTFFHLDDKRHGEDDLQDVVYNKKYLQSLDWVDENKIGVMGGSYGGFLTMAAMTFTQEFDVGINIVGVTNWVRTLESIPPYWEAFKQALYDEMGDPATDKKRLHSISPVFFGHQVTKPVLVVQGANDPRVLQVESDDMVAAIREAGNHVEYVLFEDEGHGFSKKENRIVASERYLKFLKEFLN
ncbi:S9 family peptidase [Alteromonas sp. M12]|uniref:S9 family peptidase n=1 Tax=Alteromonas sp. M12 TaxID=3135644 RepID=UPI00319E9BDD